MVISIKSYIFFISFILLHSLFPPVIFSNSNNEFFGNLILLRLFTAVLIPSVGVASLASFQQPKCNTQADIPFKLLKFEVILKLNSICFKIELVILSCRLLPFQASVFLVIL